MGYRGPTVAEGGEGRVEDVHDMNTAYELLSRGYGVWSTESEIRSISDKGPVTEVDICAL